MVWRILYVALLAAACFVIAKLWHNRWFLYAFAATAAVGMYSCAVLGFRGSVDSIGRPAMTAFAWSIGMLLLGFLISAHKARWLPRRLLPRWNGNGPDPPASSEPNSAANGLSADSMM